jgi:hypothetical protein
MVLLVLVGVALTVCTVAATPTDGTPKSGSVGLTGTMPGPAPKTAATIGSPKNGQHFSTTPITVAGTCPDGTLVEIYKNDIFAGSVPCGDKGTYSIDIDLLIGENRIVARVYNDLNEPGPDSQTVTVFYDALPPQASGLAALNFGGSQMLLNTDAVFRGTFPGQNLNVPITILGGSPPYAVNVAWGDSKNSVIPRGDNLAFNASHVYSKAGPFQITIQATDSQSRTAFLIVTAIVNGQPAAAAATSGGGSPQSKLVALWPLYTVSVAVVVSFWLGERREKHLLVGPVYHAHA